MRHTLSVHVENRPGVLMRVTSLFVRRGFNIESLAVGPTERSDVSRITMRVDCSQHSLEQIEKQVQEAPHDLFRDAKLAATNALVTQYEKFLDDPSGDAYVKEVEVSRIPRAKKKAVATSDEYADAW